MGYEGERGQYTEPSALTGSFSLQLLVESSKMDEAHRAGVALAAYLQEHLHGSEDFWLWVTYLGDPGCIFLLYFPLAYALQHQLGVTVLWLGVIGEWLNLVFKWFLFGERPFWWVYETGLHEIYNLTQFPSTCETGPGSPSGHCMITGAALWPIVMFCTGRLQSGVLRTVPLILYLLLMAGIAVSRLLILAHFPHQVVAGILTGVFLGYVLPRTAPHDRNLVFFLRSSLFLLLGALLVYCGISAFGVDLSWSIHRANKWCAKTEWIRPETRPFSSVTRSAGNTLGLGFALHFPFFHRLHTDTPGWRERGISMVLSFLFLKLQHALPLPVSPPLLYYLLNFMRHCTCPLIVIILAPYIVRCLNPGTMQKRD
ncbi:glucose-6-phosphatase 3 isoform X2 [Ranitomeya variabilis]|uniref:glucose-6-phosphatase 3 isoform X2 n=1 Tax=Ranitomeya variabilis TaxID=490064 RepID=UPI004055B32E